jgi:hypothetical protein
MNKYEEAVFEEKADRHFREQRELPNGRNFLWNEERFHGGNVKKAFDMGMCRIFPDAPGSFLCGACLYADCELRDTKQSGGKDA